ncbi:MAG: phosphoglucomutase/phosphomannomutase family protein [bacterium]|nr:phosphoglucomutase/phosphomannomutase family protein [bacterium]
MTKIKFGTDGWRALIAEDFTFENVRQVIQAFCDYQEAGLIILGYDRRFQSDAFARTVASVLTGNGFKVLLSSSYCPTPCVAWMTQEKKAIAGVMVTASHNPSAWNGIKFKESYGGSASPEYTKAVESILEKNISQGKIPKEIDLDIARQKGLLKEFDPKKEYLKTFEKFLSLDKIQKRKWKIGFDPLFGAGADFLTPILGENLLQIHGEANPSFGGLNPEPIEKNLKALIRLVQKEKCDVGLSTDGDADRIGAVDEQGNFVDSHHIFALILRHLVEVKGMKGDVVKTVSTTGMIDQLTKKYNLPLHETAIGFKHICKKFLETNPLMGGEESGGIAIAKHLYERDGLLSGLMLVEIMTHHNKRLSELIEDLHGDVGPHFFERDDLHLKEEQMVRIRGQLPTMTVQELAGQKVTGINRADGCKFYLADNSWLLIRASGTEPLLRVYAEADRPEKVKKIQQAAKEILRVG